MNRRAIVGWMIAVVFAALSTLSTLHAAQINFIPRVFLSEEYNDNIFQDPDNEEEDFITTAGVDLTGQVLWQTAGLELNYSPSYSWYADNSDQDEWRHLARAFLWKDIRRNTRLSFRNTYLRTQDPDDQSDPVDAEDPLSQPDIVTDRTRRGLNEYYTNVTSADITHRFGERNFLRGGALYSIKREVDPVDEDDTDDFDIWSPNLGFAYWWNVRWGLEGEGLYSNRDYEDRDDREEYSGDLRLYRSFTRHLDSYVGYQHTYLNYDEEIEDTDYNVYAPYVGIRYQFEKNAQISVGFGYYWQIFEDNDLGDDDDDGFFVNSEFFKKWLYRRGYVNLIGGSGYDIEDTGDDDLGFNLYYQARVEAGYDFTRRLSGDVFGGYRYDDYPDSDNDRSDQTFTTGAGVNYLALRWMKLRLQYRLTDVSSDVDSQEYTENSVLFTVTLQPTQPYRLNR